MFTLQPAGDSVGLDAALLPADHDGLCWRRCAGVILLAAAFLFGGCASKLPLNVERPVSVAIKPGTELPLAQTTRTRKLKENRSGAGASGFALLTGPQAAYGSRLALVEKAQKSLDLQYYAIHADTSTERLMRSIADAAKRGVRVRILLDDFHGSGQNALVMRMAFVPNIQMRMFNPLPGDRDQGISRMWHAATDFQRAQQRMHNKLFLADNVMGVMGGRNLGDSYFGNSESTFIDSDMLIAGPLVQELSRSFDEYWNNQRSYPVQSLIDKKDLDRMRAQVTAQRDAEAASGEQLQGTDGSSVRQESEANAASNARAQRRGQAWDMRALNLQTIPLVWANAVMLADQPGKIPAVDADGQTDPLTAHASTLTSKNAVNTLRDASNSHKTSMGHNAAPSPDIPDSVVDGLISLIDYVHKDLLIVSPYFVPGERMMAVFKAAVARGVRVRVLTNSLASNDAPVAHIGYARYREQLLKDGVELYELDSDPSNLRAAFGLGSTGSATPQSERVMLHSKMLVLDGNLTVIGSMNLDQRSQLQNTEIAVLVRSKKLSAETAELIKRGMEHGAWRVVLDDANQLTWKAPPGTGQTDKTTEPDTSLPLRMMLKILSPLVPDSVL